MATTKTCATLTPYRINFINENDTRSIFLCVSNKSRTRDAPTPTNISTKSEPLIEKNGTPASPATARASKVLPVPGGPTNRTPFGIRAPTSANLRGSFKNSTTSTSSCFSSSAPATSLKRTFSFRHYITSPYFSQSS